MEPDRIVYNVYWDHNAADSYLYGSSITFMEDHAVRFENSLMPSSSVIKEWHSSMDYGEKRMEPQLPIMQSGHSYRIRVYAVIHPENTSVVRFLFINRQGEMIGTKILYESESILTCPENTYQYIVQIIQGGSELIYFHHIEITPLTDQSKDETTAREKTCSTEIYNCDINDPSLNIILPDVYARMYRTPDSEMTLGISNLMFAPPTLVMDYPFFDSSWLDNAEVRSFQRLNFISCYPRTEDAAYMLAMRYDGHSTILHSAKELRNQNLFYDVE